MIAEDILRPDQMTRLGRDFELRFEHFLVLVVARTQHHSMLAERDWPLKAIYRYVPDGQDWHAVSESGYLPELCIFCASNTACHDIPIPTFFCKVNAW
jgi:hypothetical protein